jgi:hypothetical protein
MIGRKLRLMPLQEVEDIQEMRKMPGGGETCPGSSEDTTEMQRVPENARYDPNAKNAGNPPNGRKWRDCPGEYGQGNTTKGTNSKNARDARNVPECLGIPECPRKWGRLPYLRVGRRKWSSGPRRGD